MTRSELAIKNAARRPLRTAVTVSGVAIAIAALFTLLSFQRGYQSGVQGELSRLGAHILVVPKGCPYDAASIALHGARWPCYLKAEYLEQVRTAPGVGTAAPVFMNALYDTAGEQTVYVGVDRDIAGLKRSWRWSGTLPQQEGDLLVGSDIASRRGWALGESIDLPGVPGHRGTVRGLLETTGGADDGFIYMRLADAQRVFEHPGELTHILVRLSDSDRLDQAVMNLRGCSAGLEMNVVPLTHLFKTISNLVSSTRLLMGAIVAIALLLGGAGVSNALLMSVVERTREIGTMRAIGASRPDIFRLFWMEAIQVSAVGGVIGSALAYASSRAVELWLRARLPFAPTDVLLGWEWGVAGGCLVGAILVGSIAGLLPAWRASCLTPIDAMRTQG